jgi:hypothetical protein
VAGEIVNSHKNVELPLHMLSFIADIGLSSKDPEISRIIDLIMEHKDDNNIFQVLMNIPRHFGGTGENTWGWMICDAPIIYYLLLKFEGLDCLQNNGIKHLPSSIRANGWPCTVSPEMEKFRGPGRKDDRCPYATLLILKLLVQVEEYRNSKECRMGAEALLNLWENSRETHPYMFYMGTGFRKLKVPTAWYDIVSVTDVLSQFEWLRNDSRLLEMVEIIKSIADDSGRLTPKSQYKACKDWDFGQKKSLLNG